MATRAPLVLLEGALFHGRYRIRRTIRAGGMGAVHEVLDETTRRRRALKVMLGTLADDPDLRARFAQEATITSELESEHLADVHDAGVDEETGVPFIVMDLLDGEDAGELLARRGHLSADETIDLLRQAARVVDQAHERGIVHRDLKPANLFLARLADGGARLKVLDFGIAKVIAASMTSAAPTRSVGTPLYMAPEQARGEGTIDGRADLYSLAQIAFTLLAGKPYFDQESRAGDGVFPVLLAVTKGIEEPATARAARAGAPPLPPRFDEWFARATALDPGARFDTATEMIESLAEALGHPSTGSTNPALSSPARPSRPVRAGPTGRLRILVAAAAITAAVAAVVGSGVLRGPPSTEQRPRDVSGSAGVSGHMSTPSTGTSADPPPLATSQAVAVPPPPAPSITAPAPSASAAPSTTATVVAPRSAAPASPRAPAARPGLVPSAERPPEEVW